MRKQNSPVSNVSSAIVPKGVHFQPRRRAGEPTCWYIYPWRGENAKCVAKIVSDRKPQLTAKIIREIRELITLRDNSLSQIVDPRAPTTPLSWLINRWKTDPDWLERGDGTRRIWSYELKYIADRWGVAPLLLFYDERMVTEVFEWRDSRRKTKRSADRGITVLRQLLQFGAPLVGSTVDITRNIPALDKGKSRADIIWTDEEVDRFIDLANTSGKPEVAYVVRLAALTGMRRSDLITVCKAHVGEQAIIKRTRKEVRGRAGLVALPTFSRLAALLLELKNVRRAPGVRTLLVNASGQKWDADHLTHEFGRIRNLANIKHVDRDTPNRKPKVIMKTLHDVRGTFATKLIIEAHLSDPVVAEIMGWQPQKVHNIRRAYVDEPARIQALAARMRRKAA